ncbi:MAG: AAA family ATPase [Candidatus Vogelbacteria bacterium]|nr:AAA family ATPase [Candidatus Vogelbacteria bacterium]
MYPLRRYTKLSPWRSVLTLETYLPHRVRHWIINATVGVGVLGSLAVVLRFGLSRLSLTVPLDPTFLKVLDLFLSSQFIGLLFVLISVAMFCVSLESFFRSHYFDDISGKATLASTLFSFEVAWVLHWSRSMDPLVAFLTSIYGRKIMRRLGITEDQINIFVEKLVNNPEAFTVPELPIDKTDEITLPEFVTLLTSVYPTFVTFLAENGVQPVEATGAADWVVWKQEVVDRKERWWSKENLDQIPSVGASWGYGYTFLLDKYSRDLFDDPALYLERFKIGSREREVRLLETVLSRQLEANAILVAETGGTKMDVIYELVSKIREGNVVPELKYKRPILFQTGVFLAGFKDKASFETAFLSLFNQVVKAGNILFVIDDLPNLVKGAMALESNLTALLDPYLASSLTQVIALADTDAFYQVINPQPGLLNRFEKIQVEDLSYDELVRMLEIKLLDFEYASGVRITYPALTAIIESAENYFQDGGLQDKAVDLLVEIISAYGSRLDADITKKDVYAYIKSKTNVPIGEIEEIEKDKLLNLEAFLGARVVGQTEAVSVVSNAMRRARTAIRNPKKPIGSFLFLGPTGVGKTETAKALAEAFFGSDEAMNRLDMSEYQGEGALEKLIGSFTDNKPGVLSTMMRERPYGVLLLDEFEKTTDEVHNLFLQVLDEGFFSDMLGKRINIRNTIVIATSNAGSDFIWTLSEQGKNLVEAQDELVNQIIKGGIYKPELINRFDGVVIFHPLLPDELNKIAGLMLKKLVKRLSTQGVELQLTPELISFVANQGANKAFGARPMQRFIQDNVEQVVAQKLIAGTVGRGSKISISPDATGVLNVLVG